MSNEIILETEDLTKEFAGFVAVNGISLQVERGTIHALIGPNGAGKTTCFNLLTKFLQPTRGRITYKGQDITGLPPTDIARLGLVRSFQISAVFPHLTCRENIRIALQRQRGGSFDFWRSKRVLNEYNDRAMALLADVGLREYAEIAAVELPYGRKRALEIATTLALDPDSAPLTPVESAAMRFARKVVEDATSVSAEDVAELRDLGLSDPEIFDIAAAAAVRCFFSKTLDALGVQPDPEYTAVAPELREALVTGRPIAEAT